MTDNSAIPAASQQEKIQKRFILRIRELADGEAWRIAGFQRMLRWMERSGKIRIEHMDADVAEIVAYDDEIGFFQVFLDSGF